MEVYLWLCSFVSFFASCLSWAGLLLVGGLVLQAVRILRSDCDLRLKNCEYVGKGPLALRGKVVWITGASSGIGEALAFALAKAGSKLVLTARREKELRRVLDKCNDLSPQGMKDAHMVLPMDILELERHADACVEVLGNYGMIDILVNNAGRSQRAIVMETHPEVDRTLMELNTLSTMALTKAVLPHMVEQKRGYIVTVNSVAGKLGSPGSASYCASKHALQGFFDALRMEVYDEGIRVLNVCPGPIDTPITTRFIGNTEDQVINFEGSKDLNRMPVERCVHLMVLAMANGLEEVWISPQPILLFTYLSQYAPDIARWLGNRVGGKRSKAVKQGLQNIDGSFFK